MRRTRQFAHAGTLLAGLLTLLTILPASAQRPADVQPETIIRGSADFLGQQAQYECEMTAVMEITADGLQNKMESVTAFRVDRPSRFALVLERGFTGATMVCDGETLITHLPMLNRYSKQKAPKDIAVALTDPSAQALSMAGPMGGVAPIGGDAYYNTMMTAVSKSEYLGEETLSGVACHHCRFEQAGMAWEMWVEQGAQPLPRKIVFDLADQMDQVDSMFKNAKMNFYVVFSDWNFAPEFADTDFQFEPPADATEVEDLLEEMIGGGMDDEPHPLLSKLAPAFKAENLDQKTIDLADHFGEQIVILDFWATWCGPCIDALPTIAEIAKKYEDRGVRLFAVNCGEEPEAIREFLTTAELDLDVLLDPEGAISDQFEADAIPQTVIVGLDGKVQVVHVGLSGELEEQLSGQLDRLLKGEDLAAETLERAAEAMEELAANDFGAASVWSYPCRAIGIAADNSSARVFAVDASGEVVVLDKDGAEIGSTTMGQGGKIRSATLVADDEPEFLTYGSWGRSVQAFTASGSELWDYTLGQGIDDVWPADLTGDGVDEVIIGYNGATGLHVLDQSGKLLWKFTEIGNVWHVAAGDVDGDGQAEVATTSAQGQVHIFDLSGVKEKDIRSSVYANMIRTTPGRPYAPGRILVIGSTGEAESMISLSLEGDNLFELALPTAGTSHIDEMMLAADQPWAAVAMRGGLVHVVDFNAGKIIASVTVPGQRIDVGWLSRKDNKPLLLTASGRAVAAFEVRKAQ